ncbi:helix-turn-helix transcriptional regulator [Pelosinus sp. IPA-1]|uniref:helix-turn-helix transcriptional regulator n=1 Tax=Pelosinus sp. IPA-1 TaxID=3029569 RepID=UPI0024361FB0|nr:helix-turn-helix transcriptional regulator [Pelosinus sp. IPA-1]GMA99992.1 transcriptional regulator [Pelosinus sp. IPA-1]
MVRNWLVEFRHQQGVTHQEVADKANIKRAYYTQIELGLRNPSPKVAKRIALTLDFDWELFFAEKCSEKRQKE